MLHFLGQAKRWSIWSVIGVLALSPGCMAQSNSSASVSMIDLIVEPQRYVGIRITAIGYLDTHANLMLFLSKDHAESGDYASAVVVSDTDKGSISQSDCVGTYVMLTGEFAAYSDTDYALVEISRVLDAKSRLECWSAADD